MMRSVLQVTLALCASVVDGAPNDLISQADFRNGVQGWTIDGKTSTQLVTDQDMLIADDTDRNIWYFVASPEFLVGDKSVCHHGLLRFTQGHFEYESNEEDHLKDWDVILIGKYTIGIKDVFEAWELSKQYDVRLVESAGWLMPDSGIAPTTVEFLVTLQTLKGLKIRGGHYAGAESAWLLNVTFIQGYTPGEKYDDGSVSTDLANRKCSSRTNVRYDISYTSDSAGGDPDIFKHPHQQPFSVIVNMSAVPLGCSAATLYLSVEGDVANLNHTLNLYGEDGEFLGEMFQDDLTQLPEPYSDMIAIGQNRMTKYLSDKVFWFRIDAAAAGISAKTVTIRNVTLTFVPGGCYYYKHTSDVFLEYPFSVMQTFKSWTKAAGDGAISMTINANIRKEFTYIDLFGEYNETLGYLYGPGYYESGTILSDTMSIKRSAINNYISDGNISIQTNVKGAQNLLGEAQLIGVWFTYPLYNCFHYYADHTTLESPGHNFLRFGMHRDNLYSFTIPTPKQPQGHALLTVAAVWQNHKFNDIPIGACCGRSLYELRTEFPRGMGVIMFHETPPADFGGDPTNSMGELLGYLFDRDYTGIDDSHLVDTLIIPFKRLTGYFKNGFMSFTYKVPPGTGAVNMHSFTLTYPT